MVSIIMVVCYGIFHTLAFLTKNTLLNLPEYCIRFVSASIAGLAGSYGYSLCYQMGIIYFTAL